MSRVYVPGARVKVYESATYSPGTQSEVGYALPRGWESACATISPDESRTWTKTV